MSLEQIGELLGAPVPASARRHRSVFWSNTAANAYAKHWRGAGYRTVLRGLPDDEVAFVRDAAAPPPPVPRPWPRRRRSC